MNKVKITSRAGSATEMRVICDGMEIQDNVSKIEIVMEAGEIISAKLTDSVSGEISQCVIESVDIK